ncbi:DUF1178 family protein [Rhodoferax sp. GW822-FHT02A01]|uniref:DUF1178 family protein n=1 Tax=Rhodoferax sp. GW822-FHT02A01 TaxID=3141537 RepID=UPI00315D7FB3
MKVLDLQCSHGHTFEGWFASEDDYLSQSQRGMVQCPLCGDASVQKKLSAPRLNLSTQRLEKTTEVEMVNGAQPNQALMEAWLELSRKLIAQTQDVGDQFAEEARKMHYGEKEERAIRGKTTLDEARALLDEGIDVLPMLLSPAVKETLQ